MRQTNIGLAAIAAGLVAVATGAAIIIAISSGQFAEPGLTLQATATAAPPAVTFVAAPADTPAPAPGTPASATLPPEATVSPASTVMEPSPLAPVATAPARSVVTYTVVQNDTLWGIAVKYGLTIEEIVAANPGLKPDRVYPGDVITVPVPGSIDILKLTPTVTTTVTTTVPGVEPVNPPVSARVAPGSDQLRLRKAPNVTTDNIIARLPALTPLTIVARTADRVWLEVRLADGTQGWVMSQYVEEGGGTPPATPAVDSKPGAGAPISIQSLPRAEPYLTGFTTRVRDVFRQGQARGNYSHVFALLGDSNTENPSYFLNYDTGTYDLGEYGYLEDTIQFFKGSFSSPSASAVGGFNTTRLQEVERAKPELCQPGETPIVCEFRRKKPGVVLILIGTNDRPIWQDFEKNYRPLIEYTLSQGVVPVLMTKGDDMETQYGGPSGAINSVIVKLAGEYGVPLLDLHQVVSQLPNGGFEADGFHFNTPPDGNAYAFTGDHLKYGYTVRNLTSLQALDAVRRLVLN